MGRFRWPLMVFVICLPVAVLAAGVEIPWFTPGGQLARPLPVPDGDQEVVWLHTTTNAGTWERFVAGVQRASLAVPGMRVDDSRAFRDQTTTVPEVVIGTDGAAGRLRIRWYKISSYAKTSHWIQALARRDPAPLAIIGGGSSDRARDLAVLLERQTGWRGDRPVLLLTTATAEKVDTEPGDAGGRAGPDGQVPLVRVYDGRTFRFCFGDRQMAEAMIDFVWSRPELRPRLFQTVAPMAVGSGLTAVRDATHKPAVFYVDWNDDPYSYDLLDQFRDALPRRVPGGVNWSGWRVPFSVGGYYLPNRAEAEAADAILKELHHLPPQRAVLVVPTVPSPARRLLRTLCDADPRVGDQLVAVNGDGMQVNTILRDGEFAWPVYALPIPVVLFTHNNPLAWDPPGRTDVPPGYELRPPTSTEDVLHFAELTRVLVGAAFPKEAPAGPVDRADVLVEGFRALSPAYFDARGNRLGGKGEYVVLFKPAPVWPATGGLPDAVLEAWRRAEAGTWELTRSLPVHQSRTGDRGP